MSLVSVANAIACYRNPEYADDTLATYKVKYQPGGKGLLDVFDPKLYDTPHRSPQPHLWELGEAEWLHVVRVPEYTPRERREILALQGALFSEWIASEGVPI